MQSHMQQRDGIYVYDRNTGNTTIERTTAWSTDNFTVSGFSKGDFVRHTNGTFTKVVQFGYRGRVTYPDVPFPRKFSGQLPLSYVRAAPAVDFANVQNQAISKLYDGLRGNTDLSIDFAERSATTRMLRNALSLTNFVRKIHPKNWANNWLEYQYGWRPLVNGMYGALDEMMAPQRSGIYICVGSGQSFDKGVKQMASMAGLPVFDHWSDSLRCQYKACFEIRKPSVLQQLGNYTSLNPASIAWELMPYSFVADWFVDVGGYMRSMETALLYFNNLVWAGKTNTRLYRVQSRYIGANTSVTANALASYELRYKQRLQTGLVLPALPRPQIKLGWQRLLSAAALLSQHIGKR